ncbi:hypothetical protein CRENBAI_021220 [Crenichthys baileyi]|uniref:Uncharacterized protein n=1 Tax=Crenichthys baileyi TaxID=28760 RepID=A0AAV9REW5_9TELE
MFLIQSSLGLTWKEYLGAKPPVLLRLSVCHCDSVPVRCGRTRDQLQTKSPRTNKSANVLVTSICLVDWLWISALPSDF